MFTIIISKGQVMLISKLYEYSRIKNTKVKYLNQGRKKTKRSREAGALHGSIGAQGREREQENRTIWESRNGGMVDMEKSTGLEL